MEIRKRLVGAPPASRWQRVNGPIGATIACLAEIGWNPNAPDVWFSRDMTKWSMEGINAGHMPIKNMELIQSINTDALRMVEAAAPPFGPRGFSTGIDWRQVALRIAQLMRHGDLQEASLLETHACGGIWTPQRLANEGYSYSSEDGPKVMCRLCGAALDSEEHRTYRCEATQRALPTLPA